MNPIEAELYRLGDGDRQLGRTFLDVFSLERRPAKLLGPGRFARLSGPGVRPRGRRRREVLRVAGRELWAAARNRGQRLWLRLRPPGAAYSSIEPPGSTMRTSTPGAIAAT